MTNTQRQLVQKAESNELSMTRKRLDEMGFILKRDEVSGWWLQTKGELFKSQWHCKWLCDVLDLALYINRRH